MEIVLVIIALVVYVGMLVHAYVCKGDIECLSDIAYDKHKWLFPAMMGVIAFCLFLGSVAKTPDERQFLCFLAMIGCFGVGITPYKDSDYKGIHRVVALSAMALICSLWCVCGCWWMPFLFCLAGLRKKWLLGVELGIMASAFAYALI